MLQKLLAVLGSAAAINKCPTLDHFIPVTEDSNEFITAAVMERYRLYYTLQKYLPL